MNRYPVKKNYGLGLFDDFFDNSFFSKDDKFGLMRTDVKENDDNYVINIDLPGFKKSDIKINVENKYLTVSAETAQEDEETTNEGAYIFKERYNGVCSRSYYVGDTREEAIKASYNDGILKIVIPKEDAKKIAEKKYISID